MNPRRAAASEYLPAARLVNTKAPSSPVISDVVALRFSTLAMVTRACDSGAPDVELTTLPAMRKPPAWACTIGTSAIQTKSVTSGILEPLEHNVGIFIRSQSLAAGPVPSVRTSHAPLAPSIRNRARLRDCDIPSAAEYRKREPDSPREGSA